MEYTEEVSATSYPPPGSHPEPSSNPPWRWVILAIGVLAQASSCSFIYGTPFLLPTLQRDYDLSLGQAGLVVACPSIGILLTLILWGAAADRWGERWVMTSGLLLTAACLLPAALLVSGSLALLMGLFVAGGAAGASVNAASGRLIMGWFRREERGVAMGIRQSAQPLGVGIAALTLPALAAHVGLHHALLLPVVLILLSAVLLATVTSDPPRPPKVPGAAKPASPYRTPTLWRLHGASAMLVIPQFAVAAFALVYLQHEQHWAAVTAGAYTAAIALVGALGRVGTGWWSDRVGSRLRPMRQLAIMSTGVLLLFAVGDAVAPWLAVLALALGGIITVADNGLAFTATAEIAGNEWAGRALGVQNTGQNFAASLAPPILGALIAATSYGAGFALAALAPVLAIFLVPVAGERALALRAEQSPSEQVPGAPPAGPNALATPARTSTA